MTIKQIGIDIGKTTFHVIGIDDNDRIVLRKQFSRSQLQCRVACNFCVRFHIQAIWFPFESMH